MHNARTTLNVMLLLTLIVAQPLAADVSEYQQTCQNLIDQKGQVSDDARITNLFSISWQHRMENFPEWGASLGYPNLADHWTDNSLEAIARRKAETEFELELLRSIDREKLSSENRLNYDLFLWRIRDAIEGNKFLSELMPINQMGGVQQDIAQTFSQMPTKTVDQVEDILSRLGKVTTVIDQSITLMQEGLIKGITPPRKTLRDVSEQIGNQITDDPYQAPMLSFLKSLGPNIDKEDKERIREEATTIYTSKIVPSLQRFKAFFEERYFPYCRELIGLSELPDGSAWYAHLVRHYTTTDKSPQEIYELGLTEVTRIRAIMDSIISATDFDGSYADFCDFLRTDSRFYFERPEELLRAYRDISKRADPELVKLFGRLPRLPYGVEAIPEYAAKSQTTAYFMGGSMKAGRPGIFFANTYDLKSRPKWEMEALTLHEAVPGHHFQGSLAKELEDLPEFRRHGWFTAYGEGWGLYAESLGEEMGFYADPYSKFGQLTYELWRAIRLVVDVGMHNLGWSRQKTIDYFKNNSCATEHNIIVEVDRYIVWPGQALAYKIGELKIKELRERATRMLGDRFDIRAFHDEVLGAGALPLSTLETRIDSWIASQAKE